MTVIWQSSRTANYSNPCQIEWKPNNSQTVDTDKLQVQWQIPSEPLCRTTTANAEQIKLIFRNHVLISQMDWTLMQMLTGATEVCERGKFKQISGNGILNKIKCPVEYFYV